MPQHNYNNIKARVPRMVPKDIERLLAAASDIVATVDADD